MATNPSLSNGDTVKRGWLLEKIIAALQVIILIVVGVMFSDLREVRDGYIKMGVKQDGLVTDVKNVEVSVSSLNNTVQRLVGKQEAQHD